MHLMMCLGVNSKLRDLSAETTTSWLRICQYISDFQLHTCDVEWNVLAIIDQFQEGFADEVKNEAYQKS